MRRVHSFFFVSQTTQLLRMQTMVNRVRPLVQHPLLIHILNVMQEALDTYADHGLTDTQLELSVTYTLIHDVSEQERVIAAELFELMAQGVRNWDAHVLAWEAELTTM
jgi:hypothetical protein